MTNDKFTEAALKQLASTRKGSTWIQKQVAAWKAESERLLRMAEFASGLCEGNGVEAAPLRTTERRPKAEAAEPHLARRRNKVSEKAGAGAKKRGRPKGSKNIAKA